MEMTPELMESFAAAMGGALAQIMAGIEFIDVDLGYMDVDNPMDARVVPVPEQSQDTLVPDGPLLPGHVFALGHADDGEMAIFKLENRAVRGDFKLTTEGVGSRRDVKDTMEAAFRFFENSSERVALGLHALERDYLLYFRDLQGKGLSCEVSLAEFVGLCSAASGRPVTPGMAIPGILRMSGTMDELRNLEDIFRVAKNAGAKKILLPMGGIKDIQNVPAELLSGLSPVFYLDGDAVAAAQVALEL